MPGDRLFDPSSSLTIRDPQDNASTSDKIRNPPRYMQLGGLTSGKVRGPMVNGRKGLGALCGSMTSWSTAASSSTSMRAARCPNGRGARPTTAAVNRSSSGPPGLTSAVPPVSVNCWA